MTNDVWYCLISFYIGELKIVESKNKGQRCTFFAKRFGDSSFLTYFVLPNGHK